MPISKLPKANHVLSRFIQLERKDSLTQREAAVAVDKELREVWCKHFGEQLIYGRKVGSSSSSIAGKPALGRHLF